MSTCGRESPPNVLFFLKSVLAIVCPLFLHLNFRATCEGPGKVLLEI